MSIRDMVARRSNFDEDNDFFPTPAYATRALFEYVVPHLLPSCPGGAKGLSIWDPACGAGHQSAVYEEMGFKKVVSSDFKDYGYPGTIVSRFQDQAVVQMEDIIATNPPYAEMMDFFQHGYNSSKVMLALLTRIQFLEGQKRYAKIFDLRPPTTVGIFSDRIPFKKNMTTRKVSRMFTHCWCVWEKGANPKQSRNVWIPPDAMDKLEKPGDWDE